MPPQLRLGAKGDSVKELQELLNRQPGMSGRLSADGDFGPATRAAVCRFQATHGLGIDGVVGPLTWAALTATGATPAGTGVPLSRDAPWMAVAEREQGQAERKGAEHNPRILLYHATTTLKAEKDETAWCSSFVNWCLVQVKIVGTNSAAAKSWLIWGKPTMPAYGAITVIHNPEAANTSLSVSGNHVGFLIAQSGQYFTILGGNQADQVKVSRFPRSSWILKGHRWPQ